MSRSNPTTETQNPSQRWFEWDGDKGGIRFYNKLTEAKESVPLPFTFVFLDQLATVKGWNEPSKSGIYANEVKNLKEEKLIVKSFKGPQIAEGLYADIKLKVNNAGGDYHSSIYIAYKDGNEYKIGNLSLKGAGVNSWIEFFKANRKAVNEQAVTITGSTEGKKGKIVYRMPDFSLKAVNDSTQEVCVELDKELQVYLNAYLGGKNNKPSSPSEPSTQELNNSFTNDNDANLDTDPFSATGLNQTEIDNLPF